MIKYKGNQYVSFMVIVLSFLVYLDLGNYAGILSGVAAAPKYIYFGIFLLLIPIVVLYFNEFVAYLGRGFSVWCGLFVLVNILHILFLLQFGSESAVSMTATRIQTIGFALLVGFVYEKSDPKYYGKIIVFVAVTLTSLQLIDFFTPGFFVPAGTEGLVLGRSSSTLVNANKSAEVLLLMSVIGLATLRPSLRIWLFAIVFPGVLLTFSRSGIFIWFGILFSCVYFKILTFRSSALLLAVIILLSYLIYELLFDQLIGGLHGGSVDDILDRISFFTNLNASDASAIERLDVSRFALDSFYENPILGNGSGYTYFWSVADQAPHNQYLLMLAEFGMLGFIIWLSLIYLLRGVGFCFESMGAAKVRVIFVLFILFISLFTHNIFDNLYWLVTFSYVAKR